MTAVSGQGDVPAAWLAQHEPDPMLKQALDFALLEDFDHLYRYANLYELIDGKDATELTEHLTEITPGRPTIDEHRHPADEVRGHYDTHTVDPLSRLHVMTIISAEQQTMNFYVNHGTDWIEPIARGLYAEIALIEEQHVTHYESLLDPLDSWLKQLVFHEYNEVYLAETVDHANWEALGQLAAMLPDGAMKQGLAAAVREVEQDEDEHLSWARDTRARLTMMQASSSTVTEAMASGEELVARIKNWFASTDSSIGDADARPMAPTAVSKKRPAKKKATAKKSPAKKKAASKKSTAKKRSAPKKAAKRRSR